MTLFKATPPPTDKALNLGDSRKKIFQYDALLSALFAFVGLVTYYFSGLTIEHFEILIVTVMVMMLLSAGLASRDFYHVALLIYFTSGYFPLVYLYGWQPAVQHEFIYFVAVGITAFIYIPSRRWSMIIFVFTLSFGAVLAIGEFIQHDTAYDAESVQLNQYSIMFAGGFVAARVALLVVLNRYVNDHLQARENTISESERKYRNVFQYSHQGIVVYDLAKDKVVDCNEQTLKLFGYPDRESFQNITNRDVTAPIQLNGESAEEFIAQKGQRLAEEGIFHTPFIGLRYDGSEFICEETVIPDFTDGKQQLLLFMNDITTQYQARKEIHHRKVLYQALIDYSFDSIDITELLPRAHKDAPIMGNMIVRNEAMKQVFSLGGESYDINAEILASSPEIQPNGIPTTVYLHTLTKKLVQNRSVEHDWRVVSNTGVIKDLEIVTQIINLEDDRRILIRIAKDVTQRRRQEALIQRQLRDLNKKNAELKQYIESNMQLENFAAIASHDLKSPLRTLTSFTYLLQNSLDTKLSDQERQYLSFINSSAVSMQDLINDLLQFSTVNATRLKPEHIPLEALLAEILSELQVNITEKKAEITWDPMPATILADRIKLKQLLQNLISNAIKFSRPKVRAKVHLNVQDLPKDWRFSVRDNGIGIKEAYHEKIFLIFNKLHARDQFEGTGIGLALCKKIVDQHGGEIGVDSVEGQGSTFYFTLPKEQFPAAENGHHAYSELTEVTQSSKSSASK